MAGRPERERESGVVLSSSRRAPLQHTQKPPRSVTPRRQLFNHLFLPVIYSCVSQFARETTVLSVRTSLPEFVVTIVRPVKIVRVGGFVRESFGPFELDRRYLTNTVVLKSTCCLRVANKPKRLRAREGSHSLTLQSVAGLKTYATYSGGFCPRI